MLDAGSIPAISTEGGAAELSPACAGEGSQLPVFVQIFECLVKVAYLKGLHRIEVVRDDDDLFLARVNLVDEVLEQLIAGLHGVERGLRKALVERADAGLILEERCPHVLSLNRIIQLAF